MGRTLIVLPLFLGFYQMVISMFCLLWFQSTGLWLSHAETNCALIPSREIQSIQLRFVKRRGPILICSDESLCAIYAVDHIRRESKLRMQLRKIVLLIKSHIESDTVANGKYLPP